MAKKHFHRGIRLKGVLLRDARLLRGWRQVELAERAGVGERTVRKAESGEIIERHIADYLCTALNLVLEDTISAEASRGRVPSARMIARKFESDLQKAIMENDKSRLLLWLHPEVEWLCFSSSKPAIHAKANGRQDAAVLAQRLFEWLRDKRLRNRHVNFTQIHRTGNVLYLHSEVRFWFFEGTVRKTLRFWSAKLLQYEDDLIRKLDHFWGVSPISNTNEMLDDCPDTLRSTEHLES